MNKNNPENMLSKNRDRAQKLIDDFITPSNIVSMSNIQLLKESLITELEKAEDRGYAWSDRVWKRKNVQIKTLTRR